MVSVCLFSWSGCGWGGWRLDICGSPAAPNSVLKHELLHFFPPNVKDFYVASCLLRSRTSMRQRAGLCAIIGQVCSLRRTLSRWGTFQSMALLPLVGGFLLSFFPLLFLEMKIRGGSRRLRWWGRNQKAKRTGRCIQFYFIHNSNFD